MTIAKRVGIALLVAYAVFALAWSNRDREPDNPLLQNPHYQECLGAFLKAENNADRHGYAAPDEDNYVRECIDTWPG